MSPKVPIDRQAIEQFSRRWKVTEFSLFGSVLGDEFRADSDIDCLVSFAPEAHWSLLDLARLEEELTVLFGRRVDLVEKEAIRNPFRRHAILTTRDVIYAA